MKFTYNPEHMHLLEFDEELEFSTHVVHALACASEYVFAGHVFMVPDVHELPVAHGTIDTFPTQ